MGCMNARPDPIWGLADDGALRQPLDDVALEAEEDHDHRQRRDRGAGHQVDPIHPMEGLVEGKTHR